MEDNLRSLDRLCGEFEIFNVSDELRRSMGSEIKKLNLRLSLPEYLGGPKALTERIESKNNMFGDGQISNREEIRFGQSEGNSIEKVRISHDSQEIAEFKKEFEEEDWKNKYSMEKSYSDDSEIKVDLSGNFQCFDLAQMVKKVYGFEGEFRYALEKFRENAESRFVKNGLKVKKINLKIKTLYSVVSKYKKRLIEKNAEIQKLVLENSELQKKIIQDSKTSESMFFAIQRMEEVRESISKLVEDHNSKKAIEIFIEKLKSFDTAIENLSNSPYTPCKSCLTSAVDLANQIEENQNLQIMIENLTEDINNYENHLKGEKIIIKSLNEKKEKLRERVKIANAEIVRFELIEKEYNKDKIVFKNICNHLKGISSSSTWFENNMKTKVFEGFALKLQNAENKVKALLEIMELVKESNSELKGKITEKKIEISHKNLKIVNLHKNASALRVIIEDFKSKLEITSQRLNSFEVYTNSLSDENLILLQEKLSGYEYVEKLRQECKEMHTLNDENEMSLKNFQCELEKSTSLNKQLTAKLLENEKKITKLDEEKRKALAQVSLFEEEQKKNTNDNKITENLLQNLNDKNEKLCEVINETSYRLKKAEDDVQRFSELVKFCRNQIKSMQEWTEETFGLVNCEIECSKVEFAEEIRKVEILTQKFQSENKKLQRNIEKLEKNLRENDKELRRKAENLEVLNENINVLSRENFLLKEKCLKQKMKYQEAILQKDQTIREISEGLNIEKINLKNIEKTMLESQNTQKNLTVKLETCRQKLRETKQVADFYKEKVLNSKEIIKKLQIEVKGIRKQVSRKFEIFLEELINIEPIFTKEIEKVYYIFEFNNEEINKAHNSRLESLADTCFKSFQDLSPSNPISFLHLENSSPENKITHFFPHLITFINNLQSKLNHAETEISSLKNLTTDLEEAFSKEKKILTDQLINLESHSKKLEKTLSLQSSSLEKISSLEIELKNLKEKYSLLRSKNKDLKHQLKENPIE